MKEEAKLPHGGSVHSFEDLEEVFEWMGRAEDEANANVVAAQRDIGWGDYVVRLVPDLVIFGAIPAWDDLVAKERSYYADPFEPGEQEEFEYSIDGLRSRLERGYVFGEFCSEPYGCELGDAHISTLWKITRAEYEYARRNGWRLGQQLATRLKAEFAEARKERG